MKAKQFFYVCAGILMLALAYRVGASQVGTQPTPSLLGLGFGFLPCPNSGFPLVALDTTGRPFYRFSDTEWQLLAQCPPGEPAVLDRDVSCGGFYLGMSNGDVYAFSDFSASNVPSPVEFTFLGNIFGGTVELVGLQEPFPGGCKK